MPRIPLLLLLSDKRRSRHARDTNQFDESIELYEKAYRIDNNNPIILINLSGVYQIVGKFEASKKMIEKLLALDENNVEKEISGRWRFQVIQKKQDSRGRRPFKAHQAKKRFSGRWPHPAKQSKPARRS